MKKLLLITFIASTFAAIAGSPASASNRGPVYFFCTYGAGVSDRYVTDIFQVTYENRNRINPQRTAFARAVKDTFEVHEQLKSFEGLPTCNERQTRAELERQRAISMKSYEGLGVTIYDTRWTPRLGIQKTAPSYVPDK